MLVVAVVLGGLVALVALVWPWLDPLSPARIADRLVAVLNAWNGVRDFTAHVAARGAEGETLADVLYISPGNLRVDVLAPQGLTGTVFALRPVPEGWLFVHHRPWLDLGVEVRIPAEQIENALHLFNVPQLLRGIREGHVRVAYAPAPTGNAPEASPSDEFDIQGLPGQFPRIMLRVDPITLLPREIHLYTKPAGEPTITIEVRALAVNTGLELRDLFRLDAPPGRWLRPVASPGA